MRRQTRRGEGEERAQKTAGLLFAGQVGATTPGHPQSPEDAFQAPPPKPSRSKAAQTRAAFEAALERDLRLTFRARSDM
eukprot:3229960-Pyramimonas_sp.AAC.1